MSDHLDTKRDADSPSGDDPVGEPVVGDEEVGHADSGALARDAELANAAEAEQVSGATSLWADGWRVLKRRPLFWLSLFIIVVMLLMAVFPRLFLFFYNPFPDSSFMTQDSCALSFSPQNPNAPNFGRPTSTNWFGFTFQGCDMYVQVVTGARISILVGISVTVFAMLIAMVFGTLAGYYGGAADAVIARITDVWFAVPALLAGIVLLSVWEQGAVQVAIVLIVFGWPSMLRLMRSQVISGKEQDYVTASKSLGAGDLRLMMKHIIPNGITPVVVYATIYVGVIINAEAALSFLGVGVARPAVSWGLMISEAQRLVLQVPHLLLFPGAALALTVFSFLVMGDVLRDAFDPKGR